MNSKMIVFDRLKILCMEQGISIVELEETLNFGKNSLYGWKKKVPNGANLEKVADFFNVSIDYLVGRTDKKRYYDLTKKNEISVESELKKIINVEDVDNALAAIEARILEELNEEDSQLLIASWENTLRLTRHMAKLKHQRSEMKNI
ncbi:helix-turn-helix domain-containing protein [Lysinibacillus sp. NPDC096418]|uniref:helix-turn-helix domain-containing protein n=1 Tax=Lysinibacillus sp. NPDC096418 TaxID=3364138 RepID=UPI0038140EC5